LQLQELLKIYRTSPEYGKEKKNKTPAKQGDQSCNYRKKKEWQWREG